MKQLTCILTFLLFTSSVIIAQDPNKIVGSIKDNQGKFIQSATVALLNGKDSSLVKLSVSDKNGLFEFINIKNGNYLLSVSSVGFNKKYSAVFGNTSAITNVAEIILNPISKNLGGVTVIAQKPFIETKIDRTIVNVDASPTSAGSTALEVLEKSPGISVDNDGNICYC